ncbi:MAG TPA: DMT family transporter [Candidatus Acidoferrales bacterium]|nr:DMT family transporter [Candidatus Acidoferrales bacterium]
MATEAVIAKAEKVSSKRLPAYLALLGGVVCIAWSAIFVRWTDIPGPASAFYRMLIPAVVLMPTFFFDRRRARLDARTLGIIAFGGLFFAFDLAFYNTAILQTSAANATLLGNNTPIFVGLLTWLVFRQRPARAFWLGLLMAIAGAVVILWADLAHRTRIGVGDLLALAASACFAVYLMVTEKIRNSTGTLAFLRMAMISSTLALLLINLAMGISLRVPHGRTIWAVLGLGLISQLGGYLFLTYALGHLPATLTSISLLTQGPLTAAMATVLLGEPLSLAQVFGGLLVLAGVAMAHRQRHPEDECNV